jgi:hypothetical protein
LGKGSVLSGDSCGDAVPVGGQTAFAEGTVVVIRAGDFTFQRVIVFAGSERDALAGSDYAIWRDKLLGGLALAGNRSTEKQRNLSWCGERGGFWKRIRFGGGARFHLPNPSLSFPKEGKISGALELRHDLAANFSAAKIERVDIGVGQTVEHVVGSWGGHRGCARGGARSA